jgi:hypothetical protein
MATLSVFLGWLLLIAGPLLFLGSTLGLTRASTFRASLLTATGWVVLAYTNSQPSRRAYGGFVIAVVIVSAAIRLRRRAAKPPA